jgi:SAM-dependent methyltransferase
MTANVKTAPNASAMEESFFREYTSQDAVRKYTKATAGTGINHLLEHDYKQIYLQALQLMPPDTLRRGVRILEFGCGGGMNLVHLVATLVRSGVKVEHALGTDFSPVLVEAANAETRTYLRADEQARLKFLVARNETLAGDIAAARALPRSAVHGSFDLIIGVNTMRYCHRNSSQMDCARDIMALLSPGGVCVNIDMNDRFPAFRSALKRSFGSDAGNSDECYIPSLEEYAAPFEQTGFEMVRKEHFCWVPHSGGPAMVGLMQTIGPLLNRVAKSRAMRSLVVARKPPGR